MKKIVRIILKITGVLLLLGLLTFGILYACYNESLPEGKSGPEADVLAKTMLHNINYEAYKDTRFLEWSFANDAHHYKWDKLYGKVIVKWKTYSVNLNLNSPSKSTVFDGGTKITANEELIATALAFFNNDSFWLVAPFKVFDSGTTRSIVTQDDGSRSLKISYTAGGTTPGDSYVWKLTENGFPESYQMWVKIIPIGGLEATWDDWKIMESGVFLPTSHKLGPFTLAMGTVRAYN